MIVQQGRRPARWRRYLPVLRRRFDEVSDGGDMEATCHRCGSATFVIFEDKPWCRAHFLAEVEQREAAAATG
jgi:hypothetical protein